MGRGLGSKTEKGIDDFSKKVGPLTQIIYPKRTEERIEAFLQEFTPSELDNSRYYTAGKGDRFFKKSFGSGVLFLAAGVTSSLLLENASQEFISSLYFKISALTALLSPATYCLYSLGRSIGYQAINRVARQLEEKVEEGSPGNDLLLNHNKV